ncbi:MAG: dockerin type I repeat-containing protein [Planctomycetota bacterium]|nr:dockerin type I repeat-containing protein [Planctomycetota bacterium]
MNSIDFRILIVLLSWLFSTTTIGWTQSVPRGWITPLPGAGNSSFVDPADLLAGPTNLQGNSALGVCLVPEPNPWNVVAVLVIDIFNLENWVYDAVTLDPLGTVLNPSPPGAMTTGVTTDGTLLYWAVVTTVGTNQLWRTDLDGTNPSLLGTMGLQGPSFAGGLAWDGADGIWATNISGDRYDRISSNDGSYLGQSTFHPDGSGPGNGVAWRSDCERLEIPHGPARADRVTTISIIDPLTGVALAPMTVTNSAFFINGIETSRSAAAPGFDPFGVYSIWIVDNGTNTLAVLEGHQQCPEPLGPIGAIEPQVTTTGQINVTWEPDPFLDIVEFRIDGMLFDSSSGVSGQWSGVSPILPGLITLQITGHTGNAWTPTSTIELLVPGCSDGPIQLSHLDQPDLFEPGTPICGSGSAHLSQSYWRTFDHCEVPFSQSEAMLVESIRVAVEVSDPGPGFTTQPVILRLYEDPNRDAIAPTSTLVGLHEQQFQIPQLVQQHFCLNLAPPLLVPCGTLLVVEVELVDGAFDEHLFVLGSNSQGETAAGSYSASSCGIPEPLPFADLGWGNVNIGVDLIGRSLARPFSRGDSNGDGSTNLTDAIHILGVLFIAGSNPLACSDSADCNDDGSVNLADAVTLLSYLFIPGSPPIADPSSCGIDPSPPDALTCEVNPACP